MKDNRREAVSETNLLNKMLRRGSSRVADLKAATIRYHDGL